MDRQIPEDENQQPRFVPKPPQKRTTSKQVGNLALSRRMKMLQNRNK